VKSLAPANRRAEDVRVLAVVIAKLKLRDVQREILGADLMEGANHTALEDRPEAFDGIGVDRADDVLSARVIDRAVGIGLIQPAIARPLVGAEQADLFRNGFIDEAVERAGAGVLDHAGDHVAFARDGASDDFLTRAARSKADVTLVPMAILSLSTHEGFIDFHNAHELLEALIHEPGADAVAHVMGSLVGAETHHPLDLKGAHAFLAGEHEVDHPEPLAKALIGVLKDRACDVGEAIRRAHTAVHALPLKGHCGQSINVAAFAARAMHAIGPAVGDQIRRARILIGEHLLKLRDGHLLNAGHVGHSQAMEITYAF